MKVPKSEIPVIGEQTKIEKFLKEFILPALNNFGQMIEELEKRLSAIEKERKRIDIYLHKDVSKLIGEIDEPTNASP